MRETLFRAVSCAVALCLSASTGPAAPSTILVSAGLGGAAANSHSGSVVVSANGRYAAFVSDATNLVTGDTNGAADVFLQNLQSKAIARVSVSSEGVQANADSDWGSPAISADGRYVAFASVATNLAAGALAAVQQIYVHDNQTGATICASVGPAGTPGNGASASPSISADGVSVAFASDATNLVDGDTNGVTDVFVRNIGAGTTAIASLAPGGAQADGPSGFPAISGNGRYVAFASAATNLVAGDTNDATDVFVHDLQTGGVALVSTASDGTQGDDWSDYTPGISEDGRFVAFISKASNLVVGDANDAPDAFVHDMQSGLTYAVTIAANGTFANDASIGAALSGDGRYAAVSSNATNLVATDTNGATDVFVRDLWLGKTVLASVTGTSTQGAGWSGPFSPPSLCADGQFVAFESWAANFTASDTNATGDVFLRGPFFTSPVFTVADVLEALRAAAGTAVLSSAQWSRLNVDNSGCSAGVVDLIDASRIARKATGLEP